MLSNLLQKANLFYLLYLIDCDLAGLMRQGRCPHCGGPLHQANYQRKPRGGPKLPEQYAIRQSLCCGREGCRRRSMPDSCLFMGRRVYWRCVVLVVLALRQGRPNSLSAGQFVRMFRISRSTLMRWFDFFRDAFAESREWQRVRGRLSACVSNDRLPASFLEYFIGESQDALNGLVLCCRLLGKGG
jgi:hypothetical protein